MSLAELLKADLDDLEDEEAEGDFNENVEQKINDPSFTDEIEDVGMEVENMGIENKDIDKSEFNFKDKDSVKVIAKLLESEKLNKVIEQIDFYKKEELKK